MGIASNILLVLWLEGVEEPQRLEESDLLFITSNGVLASGCASFPTFEVSEKIRRGFSYLKYLQIPPPPPENVWRLGFGAPWMNIISGPSLHPEAFRGGGWLEHHRCG